VKTPITINRILPALLLFVLLPAIFYSAYELNALSASEEVLSDVYRRQLDAVLFSVNQYAYDAASAWANTITLALTRPDGNAAANLEPFLRNNPSIRALVFTDTMAQQIRLMQGFGQSRRPDSTMIARTLAAERPRIERLVLLQKSDYRKLEGIPAGDSLSPDPLVLLLFVASADENTVGGIILDPDRFVRDVLARKITEGAGDEFVVAVSRRGSDAPVFSTGTAPRERYQERRLWLFPHLSLGIQLKGTTVNDIVRSRFRRNLILILGVDLILLAGAWLIYRTIRKEMELVRLKSDFVSNVSHELRTPLALIRMFAETLELGRVKSEEKKQEYYATILQETERLTRLINNILNFSRMEAGRKHYTFVRFDLNEAVRGVLETYAYQLRQSGFTLTESYDATLPPVTADREGVAEAVINILDNAIKYSADRRSIAIRTVSSGGSACVDIEDAGIGIAPEHREKVFEKFFRVAGTDGRTVQGSGLGLSLVRSIMDAHGGTVTLTSTPGKGSTFRLAFPLNGPRTNAPHKS
jgi:two-component system, OmpR family, phosphate regulon sensor histidine kinase PhoR